MITPDNTSTPIKLEHIRNDLKETKPRVIFNALQALGRVIPKERDEALIVIEPWLSHGNQMFRYAALLSVMELDSVDHHLEQIKVMLEDQNQKIREAAVIALGKSKKKGITNLLISLLQSPHAEIRYQAPISLAERGDQAAARPLLSMLEREGDVEIRVNVLAAMGDLGVSKALKKIVQIAHEDPYEIVRFEAACSACRMKDRSAARILAQWTDHFEYGLTACTILDELGETAIVPVLQKKYRKRFMSASRRLPLAATLARLGDDRGRNFLISKTHSFSLETRILALERLGRTKQEWALPPLLSACTKKDKLTRDAALEALMELGQPKAVDQLKVLAEVHANNTSLVDRLTKTIARLEES